jgi:aryl-alcohol dehydrogenase-like predicted oxidoreductase
VSAPAAPFKTRKLGRADVRVSELGLGTAPLGELFERVDDAEAAALIAGAWAGGVRYFDTSPWYGRGLAEHSLGRALFEGRERTTWCPPRSAAFCAAPFGPGAIHDQWLAGLEFQTVFDYGYDGVMRSFEDSLQRLGINSVDVLLIHDLDPWDHNPPALDAYFGQLKTGGWKALSELREAGIIKGIGAGFNSKESIPRYLDLFDIDFFLLAMRYAARTGRARKRVSPVRRARRRHNHRRRLQFRDPGDRRRSGRDVQLRAGGAGHSGAGRQDRARLRAPQCAARGGGVAVSAWPSDRGVDHPRRN